MPYHLTPRGRIVHRNVDRGHALLASAVSLRVLPETVARGPKGMDEASLITVTARGRGFAFQIRMEETRQEGMKIKGRGDVGKGQK
jgi:hypothetical protein